MIFHVRAALAIGVCFVFPLRAQTPEFSSFDRFVTDQLASANLPGASIAIVRGETVIYSKGFGTANNETGEAVRPEMLFRIGSTTKMFTATALAELAIEGKIDLNAPIGAYLKFLPRRLSQITADQLLSHTAGLRDDGQMYGNHDDSALGDGIRAWNEDRLFTSPGKIFSYSNAGYWLAGYLIETLTSKPYADAMEALVFKPLGMTRTTLRPTMAMTWPLAQGHELQNGQFEIVRPAADNAATWPAGSIYSNTHDLAQFVTAFMNNGRLGGKQVLDPRVIALVSSPHVAIPGGTSTWVYYCYGLQTGEYRGVEVFEHRGSRLGYGSNIRMIPAHHLGVIVLTNRTDGWLSSATEKAMELLLPLKPDPPATVKPVLPTTANDFRRNVGVYGGNERMELLTHENRLFVKIGTNPESALSKHSESSFGTERMELKLVPGPDGLTEYVYIGELGQSFARVR